MSLALALAGVSCTSDPETFCASRVEQICQVLSGCCTGSAKFDLEQCELQISNGCETQLQVEGVHSGEFVFDEGAANTCIGNVETCDDVVGVPEQTIDRVKACGNMLTGHRPAGAACQSSAQCEKDGGDFPSCYQNTICAKTILSEDECSFSLETNELRTCVPGKYCDIPEKTLSPTESPTKQALEFKGTCKSPLGVGGKCLPDGMNAVPCQDGLFCKFDIMDPEASVCESQKGAGQACTSTSECKDGLFCDFDGMESVCTEPEEQDGGLFCFVPPDCGDGVCEDPYETEENCAADCGPQTMCGDGACEAPETVATCPADCGVPDGCGDGVCQFTGTEPATCPEDCCGDGFCDPGEDAVCPTDCGA